ncbi:MAG: tetratricopeptide repeat protein [Chloroflexi bacterium]|nr:tetratricopeptide repeat protein [Chloroflexota bacterium]
MARQEETFRARHRLQNQAIELAANNQWAAAVEVNLQILELGADVDTLNRLGKASFELNQLETARDYYRRGLELAPNNPIARKNIDRLDELLSRPGTLPNRSGRARVDLRMFITEIGKTAVTQLIDVPRGPAPVVTGERVEVRLDGTRVHVVDSEGHVIGRIEPKLAQRLAELMRGGNRYVAAVAYLQRQQIRVLIREIYQDPSQRGRVSFPGTLSEGAMRGYPSGISVDEYREETEDDETPDEPEEVEDDGFGTEDDEMRPLEELEPESNDDDDDAGEN